MHSSCMSLSETRLCRPDFSRFQEYTAFGPQDFNLFRLILEIHYILKKENTCPFCEFTEMQMQQNEFMVGRFVARRPLQNKIKCPHTYFSCSTLGVVRSSLLVEKNNPFQKVEQRKNEVSQTSKKYESFLVDHTQAHMIQNFIALYITNCSCLL